MSARHFEIVRSDAGWFGRYIAANGREQWRTSETYTRRRTALAAIDAILIPCNGWVKDGEVVCGWEKGQGRRPMTLIYDVDERS